VACLAAGPLGIIELRPLNRYRLKLDKTFRWRPTGPVMQYFRRHVVDDYFSGGFDGEGETLMLVHGQISRAQAAMFNERLQRLAQDFAQQHLADQKLPADQKQTAYTMVIGMRSWLFGRPATSSRCRSRPVPAARRRPSARPQHGLDLRVLGGKALGDLQLQLVGPHAVGVEHGLTSGTSPGCLSCARDRFTASRRGARSPQRAATARTARRPCSAPRRRWRRSGRTPRPGR
jgi:hypothetical protein